MSENVEHLADRENTSEESVHNHLSDLSTFKFEKVLSNNTNRKTICLQGSFGSSDGVGIVFLEKTAFQETYFKEESEYFNANSSLKKLFHNDIYGNYEYFPKLELNCKCVFHFFKFTSDRNLVSAVKTTIIHPATEKHIDKYTAQNIYIIDETPDIYKNITLPHLEAEQFDLQVASILVATNQINYFTIFSGCITSWNINQNQNALYLRTRIQKQVLYCFLI